MATLCCGPGTTANSGADWNNIRGFDNLTLVRGNTYYLADGNYTSKTFSTGVSGATLITIKKATTSDHGTDTGWSSAYGDGQAVFRAPVTFLSNYWVFTGQARTGLRSGYGIKIDNFTVKSSNDNLILGSTAPTTASYSTFSYLEVAGTADQSGTYDETGIISADSTNPTTITIDHCWVHDQAGVTITFRSGSNILVDHCVIERDYSSPASHAEGFVLKETNGFTIRYCLISDIEGTAYIATPSGTRNHIANTYIYGNVFEMPVTPLRGGCGMGPVAVWDCDSTGDFVIYNNTVVGFLGSKVAGHPRNPNSNANFVFGTGYTATFAKCYIRNNLWVTCDHIVNPAADPYTTITDYAWSHNAYYNTTTWDASGYNYQVLGAMPLVNWPAGDYTLAAATAAGATLASPYNTDPNGTVRGASGVWDRGAYEYPTGGGGSPPTGIPELSVR